MVDQEGREAVQDELAPLVVPQQQGKGQMVDQGQQTLLMVAVVAVLVRQETLMAQKRVAMA